MKGVEALTLPNTGKWSLFFLLQILYTRFFWLLPNKKTGYVGVSFLNFCSCFGIFYISNINISSIKFSSPAKYNKNFQLNFFVKAEIPASRRRQSA